MLNAAMKFFYRRNEIRFVFARFLTFIDLQLELQHSVGTSPNENVRFVHKHFSNFTKTSVKTIDTFEVFDIEYENALLVESQNKAWFSDEKKFCEVERFIQVFSAFVVGNNFAPAWKK